MSEKKRSNQRKTLLFVCSRNQWRSPTAERIYRDSPQLAVRSGGTADSARRRITRGDLTWANLVIVMETKHKQVIESEFPDLAPTLKIHVLGIEDNYRFMDPELVSELSALIDPLVEEEGG